MVYGFLPPEAASHRIGKLPFVLEKFNAFFDTLTFEEVKDTDTHFAKVDLFKKGERTQIREEEEEKSIRK